MSSQGHRDSTTPSFLDVNTFLCDELCSMMQLTSEGRRGIPFDSVLLQIIQSTTIDSFSFYAFSPLLNKYRIINTIAIEVVFIDVDTNAYN